MSDFDFDYQKTVDVPLSYSLILSLRMALNEATRWNEEHNFPGTAARMQKDYEEFCTLTAEAYDLIP